MPKEQEDALRRVANRLARQGKLKRRPNDTLERAKNRFIYGTMAKLYGHKKRRR